MKYNKLVRDKIPQIIRSKKEMPIIHVADNNEYKKKLNEKLLEEVNEFLKEESKEEFVDIIEVINAIGNFNKFNKNEIKNIRMKKLQERGVFEKRIILEEVK